MAKTLFLSLLLGICSLSFGLSILDITLTLESRLLFETQKSTEEAHLLLPALVPLKAFLILDEEAAESLRIGSSRYLLLAYASGEWQEHSLPALSPVSPVNSHIKAASNYMALLTSFLEADTLVQNVSVYHLLSSKMEYLDIFLDELEQLQLSLYEPFKKQALRVAFADYLSLLHEGKKQFFLSLPKFFLRENVEFKVLEFEPAFSDLIEQTISEWNRLMDRVHTPLQFDSFLSGLSVFLEGLALNPKKPIGATVTEWMKRLDSGEVSDVKIRTPYHHPFFSAENTVFADLQTALLLDTQKELAIWIHEEYRKMVLYASRTLGFLTDSHIERILAGVFLFELCSLKTMALIGRYGNETARRKVLDLYNTQYTPGQDSQELFPQTAELIREELVQMMIGISDLGGAAPLFRESAGTTVPALEVRPVTTPKTYSLASAELVHMLELETPLGHFAEAVMSVRVGTRKADTFTKIYPVFPTQTTRGKPLILLDFFWFAIKQWGQTLGKLLGLMLNRTIDTIEMENRLELKGVEVTIPRYYEMRPYAELWRMQPADDQNIFVSVQNNNSEKNAVSNLFGGVIPDFLAGDIDKIPADPIFRIHRYPTEVFTTTKGLRNSAPRGSRALILVHGKQALPNFTREKEVMVHVPYIWRTEPRLAVWDRLYLLWTERARAAETGSVFEAYDFYEFVYDTSVLTAREYGQILAGILQDYGFLHDYETLVIVGHSMGGIVAREAANTRLERPSDPQKAFLGDYLSAIITLDSPHYGSVLENFVYTVNAELKARIKESKQPDDVFRINLYELLRALLRDDYVDQSLQVLLAITAKNPELVGKVFTEMVSFLDPFPGGVCLSYTVDSYTRAVADYLYGKVDARRYSDILKGPEDLRLLNQNDRFYDRLYLFTSEIDENSELSNSNYSLLYALMKTTTQKVTFYTNRDFSVHEANDCVVSLYSQQMAGSDKGQTRIAFQGIDHTAVPMDRAVLNRLFQTIEQVSGR